MAGSTRPRLRSVISHGHSNDDPTEGTSARTRPLSYDEIMCRRKNKKQVDGSREEARTIERTSYEGQGKNVDHHGRDASAAGVKLSRNHGPEPSSRKKEEKSSMEETYSKINHKESQDMWSRGKHKYEKDIRNDMEEVKTDGRGHVRGKLEDENQEKDSRSKHIHDKDVKNGTEVLETGRRRHTSVRIEEESHDLNIRSKDKHDKSVKNRTSFLNADKGGNGRDKQDMVSHDLSTKFKEKHEKNSTVLLKADKQRNIQDRLNEESHDLGSRFKIKHEKDMRNRPDEVKNIRLGDVRSKQGDIFRDAANYVYDDRRHRDSVMQDTYMGRSRGISEREYKRKDRGVDGEKYKFSDPVKKHDSGSRRDSEILQRRAKMEFSHLHHDDSRSKRRRSRSPEKPKDYDRRRSRSREIPKDKDRRRSKSREKPKDKDRRKSRSPEKPKDKDRRRSRSPEKPKDKDRRKSRSPEKPKDKDRRRSRSPEKPKDKDIRRSRSPEKPKDKDRRKSRSPEKSKDKDRRRSRSPEKPKNKDRRRSRSPEKPKDKDRSRSRSASPRRRKNMSSREHEYPVALPSQREQSKHNPAVDRSTISNNGSTGHDKRHSGFSSGIGGYSPRKRKSDVAVKTPSPIRSPERKRAGWDFPSLGVDKNLNNSAASGSQLLSQTISNKIGHATGTSVASSMGMPLSTIFYHSLSTFKEASVDSVQLTQATRPMRRLYIDNIPASASEKEIMESFNAYLLSSGANHVRGTHPCISCMIHKEKGQALLEFLTPEDASAALSFDGRSLFGSMLKVRRPKDFVGMASGSVERSKDVPGKNNAISDVADVDVDKKAVISDFVEDSPHKIFVGGIADGLSSQMIMEIFSVLGPLKAFCFVIKELGETCVFLEYADHSITSKACAALNGMKLGGKILIVSQAMPNTSFEENPLTKPLYGIPEHVKPLLKTPTLVLKLTNLLDQKALELLPELELEEIIEDVRLECSRFGSVLSINVVKPTNLHTAISEVKEVTIEDLSYKERECDDHNMSAGLAEAAMEHGEGEGNVREILSNVKDDLNLVDNIESFELATPTAIEVKAPDLSTVQVKENISLEECNDEAANGTQESVVIGESTVEKTNQEGGVSSKMELDKDIGNVKVGDSETSNSGDVVEFGKDNGKPQEVAESEAEDKNACESGNIFEIGSILVEFRRTEASSMAAHCLHGRVFDDRIVAVEYVPLAAYQAMFPSLKT